MEEAVDKEVDVELEEMVDMAEMNWEAHLKAPLGERRAKILQL